MKTAICAIAKNENAYVNDWVNYHLALGFDKIYLYDNNDPETPFVGDFIEQASKVEIIDWHVEEEHILNQVAAYNDFAEKYGQLYDWCAVIDIDEYIFLNVASIKDFLSKAPDGKNILLNWRVFGDDDIVVGDEKTPVYQRFKEPKFTWQYGAYKSIVNFKANPQYRAFSPHHFSDTIEKQPCRDSNFDITRYEYDFLVGSYKDLAKRTCYVAHYQTKTLAEFMKYKYKRGNSLRYFFQTNEITPEKLAYLKKEYDLEY